MDGRRLWLLPAIVGIFTWLAGYTFTVLGAQPINVDKPYTIPSPTDALQQLLEYSQRHERITSGHEFFKNAAYVGSKTCGECHQERFKEWSQTWHSKMERWPSSDIIVADFDTTISYSKVKALDVLGKTVPSVEVNYKVRTFKKDGGFFITILDEDQSENNQTFKVAKVLGGKWDEHYETEVLINGTTHYAVMPNRWSVEAKEWILDSFQLENWWVWDGSPKGRPRKPTELLIQQMAETKCTGCHTTGYEFKVDATTKHWKISGNGELGVACEHCHGPGSKHVKEATNALTKGVKLVSGTSTIVHPLKDLTQVQQAQICESCHTRQSSRIPGKTDLQFQDDFLVGDTDLATKMRDWTYHGSPLEASYFWPNGTNKRNRQQKQEFQHSTHAQKVGMTCITCHVFHGKPEPAQMRVSTEKICSTCHGADGLAGRDQVAYYEGSKMQKAGVLCVDCHMGKTAYRTSATSKWPRLKNGTGHSFNVPSPGKALLHNLITPCAGCHLDPPEMPGSPQTKLSVKPVYRELEELQRFWDITQNNTRKKIMAIRAEIAKVDLSDQTAAVWVSLAQQRLSSIVMDGSYGIHNPEKTKNNLRQAEKLVKRALEESSIVTGSIANK